jgi:acetyl-CoA carboxylase biotin carboxylase subunit
VPVYYDSLLSKLVVWGSDREHARKRMLRALDEFVLEGVPHNLAFHRWLAGHAEFVAGRLSTRFIEEHFTPEALAPTPEQSEVALLAAALHARAETQRVSLPADGAGSRWAGHDRRRVRR